LHLSRLSGASDELALVLAAVVFPLQRLKIAQVVTTPAGYGDDMIDFPSISASDISVFLANDRPSADIDTQRGVIAHGLGFLPNGLNDFRPE
jgi:hypothetical protein